MKAHVFLWLLLLLLVGCSHQKGDTYRIEGELTGITGTGVMEVQDAWNGYKVVGKTADVSDGCFTIEGRIEYPTHVYLYFDGAQTGSLQIRDFFLEPGTIRVVGDAERDMFEGATGTPLNELKNVVRHDLSSHPESSDERVNQLIHRKDAFALFAIDAYAVRRCPPEELLGILDSLPDYLQQTMRSTQLKNQLKQIALTSPSCHYIDIEQPDTDGNSLSLKSVVETQGTRYVLVDFWATWCGPCVEEIPTLVDLYGEYHNKGLDIYSVSFDGNKTRWINYVQEHNMMWHNVSELNGGGDKIKAWRDYGCLGIPLTILIDASSGIIIARDLRGDALRERMKELFQQQ